jgi:hypothetical protein
METSKKNKHVEVQFIADEEVGKEIISMKDAKIKNTGTNVNTCVRNVYALTLVEFSVPCKAPNASQKTTIIFERNSQVTKSRFVCPCLPEQKSFSD